MNRTIRQNLIIIICSLILVAIISSSLLTYTLISDDYEKKMKNTNFAMAESLASNVSQFMYNASNVNQMLAEYPGIRHMDSETQRIILSDMVKKYPWFQLLTITSLEGEQVARSSGIGGNRSERPWFKRFMEIRSHYISDTYYSVTSESPITTIVHGIYDNGELSGMMMADIEIDRLQQLVEKYNGGEGSYAYLLDSDGAVIAHPDRKQVADLYNYRTLRKKILVRDENGRMVKDKNNNEITEIVDFEIAESLKPIVSKVMDGEIGIGEYTELNGEAYICAYRTIELPGLSDPWSLIVVQKKSAVMAFMNSVLLKASLVGLLIIVLSALLTIWFSKKITDPIIELVEATNRLKEGDLDVTLQTNSKNEVGMLVENFNQMVCQLRENTLERERNHRKIVQMAFQDSLTSLPNRASLNAYLGEEMQYARNGKSQGALLFIDVDDFKSVNDNFGHSFGDQLLVQAGAYIVEAVGKEAFVSRLGGDEFVVVVAGNSDRQVIASLGDAVLSKLCREYDLSGEKMHISASIGIVVYPEDGNMPEDVMKKADSAMYAAKKAGRNCWCFYEPSLLQESYEAMILSNGLRRALEKYEFCLHYQPQFTADGLKIVGFEALIRWHSAEHGLVPPSRFIALAEQTGLILPVGKWALEEACRFAIVLDKMGLGDISVAVNISPKQLMQDDFVDIVCSSICESGAKASQIEIEITESVLIQSMDESVDKLCDLRTAGITISLDDFGTGYSSLTYLRKLPVSILKIDKSFIDMILCDDMQRQVVGAIMDLAHKLELSVVAEGVETEEQAAVLRETGCDYIQGYVFGKPMSEEETIALLINNEYLK